MIDPISQVMDLEMHAAAAARRRSPLSWLAPLAVAGLAGVTWPIIAGAQGRAGRPDQGVDEASRREAERVIALADRAEAGQPVPADFVMTWRQDFLKAQPGTFVPFVLTITPADGGRPLANRAFLYVRAARREPGQGARASERRGGGQERYAFDAIFPVELEPSEDGAIRVTRGFAVPAGPYDVFLALREHTGSGTAPPRAGVLVRRLDVPDFWNGQFATSTVMLARQISALRRPLDPAEALERPYAVGLNDIHVAFDGAFRRDRELIVVFVIYNPTVGAGGDFDVQADYFVFRRGSRGTDQPVPEDAPPPLADERYVTRTNPQRFNRATLGSEVDPQAGHPVMAGQGILLRSFEPGEYRLGIAVRDLLSGERLIRDVTFTVDPARD